MAAFSNMARSDLEYIYSELNGFRWPEILPLKPDDWHDPVLPWPKNGLTAMENYRRWAETDAGKTQTAIMNEIKPLLWIPSTARIST